MSEKPSNEENEKKDEEKIEISDIQPGKDFSSPEGPTPECSEFRCPICPKFAKITLNILKNEIISECPDNHYMKLDLASYLQKSTDHPINTTKCSICNSSEKTENYCLECNKYLCVKCLEKHNTNNLPGSNGGMLSNILSRNNTLENNDNSCPSSESNNTINNFYPKHLTILNLTNNSSSINTIQHHVIEIKEQDNHCALHNKEKFTSLCLKCNKSFCDKCIDEIKKGSSNNLSVISCLKLGNFNHNIKKMKQILENDQLKKIKENLDKELEVITYIENQSNLIIEQLLEKINNLKEMHLFKKELYNLYLKNQENASLVNSMKNFESATSKFQKEQFNSLEKLLQNFDIINVKLPPNEKNKQKKVEKSKIKLEKKKDDLKEKDKKKKKEEVKNEEKDKIKQKKKKKKAKKSNEKEDKKDTKNISSDKEEEKEDKEDKEVKEEKEDKKEEKEEKSDNNEDNN